MRRLITYTFSSGVVFDSVKIIPDANQQFICGMWFRVNNPEELGIGKRNDHANFLFDKFKEKILSGEFKCEVKYILFDKTLLPIDSIYIPTKPCVTVNIEVEITIQKPSL